MDRLGVDHGRSWNPTHLKNRKRNVQRAHFDRNADHIIELVNPSKTRAIA